MLSFVRAAGGSSDPGGRRPAILMVCLAQAAATGGLFSVGAFFLTLVMLRSAVGQSVP